MAHVTGPPAMGVFHFYVSAAIEQQGCRGQVLSYNPHSMPATPFRVQWEEGRHQDLTAAE